MLDDSGFVRGDILGMMLPAHEDAFRTGGAAFLTDAMRSFGVFGLENRVAQILSIDPCSGGSTGAKLFVRVEYASPLPELHTDLFVKFSRDFIDPMRDQRGKYEMEGEVRLALLSRVEGFPVRVPKAYFADYEQASHTGILITEKMDFDRDYEPLKKKCLDHYIDNPVEYYRAIMQALGRLSGMQFAGKLSQDANTLFPYNPALTQQTLPYSSAEIHTKVLELGNFIAANSQLFPADLNDPHFFVQMANTAAQICENADEVNDFLHSNADMIALCHWNANIDNAFFWRDDAGRLQCGLMDWGHANRQNVAFSLWGSLCAAHHSVWIDHSEELFSLFIQAYHDHGGPLLELQELRLHLDLYIAMIGLAYFLESPQRLMIRLPELAQAKSLYDPLVENNESARNQLHSCSVFLSVWQRHDFQKSFARFLTRSAADVPV